MKTEAGEPPHFAEVMTQRFGLEHGVELSIAARGEARPLPDLQ